MKNHRTYKEKQEKHSNDSHSSAKLQKNCVGDVS